MRTYTAFPIPRWSPKYKRDTEGVRFNGIPNLDLMTIDQLKQFAYRYSFNRPIEQLDLLGRPENLDKLWMLVWYARYRIGGEVQYLDSLHDAMPLDMQFRDTGAAAEDIRALSKDETNALLALPSKRFNRHLEYPIRYGLAEECREYSGKFYYRLTPAGESYLKAIGLK